MTDLHFVTGATGFVGGSLVLDLLASTDARILCLVRDGKRGLGVQHRLVSLLTLAAQAYGREDLIGDITERCTAVRGDMLKPGCAVDTSRIGRVGTLWHTAASLKYHDRDSDEIAHHNVYGTEQVLTLARSLDCDVFNYISTAYVAGSRRGEILEELPDQASIANNQYERTKIEAEHLVVGCSEFHTRIFRPSIVVGHSRRRTATSFTGSYGFIRDSERFVNRLAKKLGDLMRFRPLRVLAEPDCALNFIPVDAVTRGAVTIALSYTKARIFHLTNASPPTVAEFIHLTFDRLEMHRPIFVQSDESYTSIDKRFNDELDFYSSYLRNSKEFVRANTDAVTGASEWSWPMPRQELAAYVDWYLLLLRTGMRSSRAQEPVSSSDISA
jgi:thioester reductase-like protein